MLEQDTVLSSTWKSEDIADSCSLGNETSSIHSRNVSYLQCCLILFHVYIWVTFRFAYA